ncbi:HPP family protein [Roseococcus pinisoli]|uniref:HPP family protein n=1 Tax=Roseococcus pinisoli TaxID=2835040 RepID=A0ABS5QI95_9PROT|nr:HPP family protein [Roseococcus pinisoli]MBS7813419.1 HPP family protein [Roseococcus pinisoli]
MSHPARSPQGSPPPPGSRFFAPILAGATLRERLVACLGALIGIGLTAFISGLFVKHAPDVPLIAAPVGASALLLFVIPSSPLAQPWSIVMGNTVSALVGVGVAQLVKDPLLASGLGVSLSIAAMSFTRSLHPPGAAVALTAALGGPAVAASGLLFPFVPVALNSLVLVALGIAFHRLSGRAYPHTAPPAPANTHRTQDPPAAARTGFQPTDIDAALEMLDETFDIDRGDLIRLLRQVELQTTARLHGALRCRDIMSRDVVSVGPDEEARRARFLLLDHNIRNLPVVGEDGRLQGSIGLRELADAVGPVGPAMSPAATASPDQPAASLVPSLTDGRTHAVVIVDAERRVLGLITQTDLLAALARTVPAKAETAGA